MIDNTDGGVPTGTPPRAAAAARGGLLLPSRRPWRRETSALSGVI